MSKVKDEDRKRKYARRKSVLAVLKNQKGKGRRALTLEQAKHRKPDKQPKPGEIFQTSVKTIRPKKTGTGRRRPNKIEDRASEKIRRSLIRQAQEQDDELPLQYMLRRMRDPNEADEIRDRFAIEAAPYIHPKLAAMAVVSQDQVGQTAYGRIERVLVRADGSKIHIPTGQIDAGTSEITRPPKTNERQVIDVEHTDVSDASTSGTEREAAD